MKAEQGKTVSLNKLVFMSWGMFRRLGHWLSAGTRRWGVRRQRQLRLCENLALGERRFLSVVECGQQRFLLGGSANSVVVLAEPTSEAKTVPNEAGEEVPTYKLVGGGLTKDVLCG